MTIKKIAGISMLIGLSTHVGVTTLPAPAWASTPGSPSAVHHKENNSRGTLREGLPGRRIGGGTRRNGIFVQQNSAFLTAMVTADNLGITTAARPSLIFHIPEMIQDQTVEFVMRDSREELVYETTFQVAHSGGVVNVDMAQVPELAPLQIGENYRWYFSIVPDTADRANDIVVNGNIQRVDSAEWFAQKQVDVALLEQLGTENPLMQARLLYQEANLWHDAIVALEAVRQVNPDDSAIAAEWNMMLEAAELSTALEVTAPAVQIGLNENLD